MKNMSLDTATNRSRIVLLALSACLASCSHLEQYAHENSHEFREGLGGNSVIAKRDLVPLGEKQFFDKHEVVNSKSNIEFERGLNNETGLKIPMFFTNLLLKPRASFRIDKGYIREAAVVFPHSLIPAGSEYRIVYSELGTGSYTQTLGVSGTVAGEITETRPDTIVGVKTKNYTAAEPVSVTLVRGETPKEPISGLNIKYDSMFFSGEIPVANIHLIAQADGSSLMQAWRNDPGQAPKLRSGGRTDGFARRLSWNANAGLNGIEGIEHRLPMPRAASTEDSAIVMVGENDYAVLQLMSISSDYSEAEVRIQRVAAR